MKTGKRATVGVRGAVQGVGFRPFVYRLATELDLRGWVLNSGQGVSIEVEGECGAVRSFVRRLESEKPPHARIQGLESAFSDTVGYPDFEIRHSEEGSEKTAFISPDLATCEDCLRELLDPANRRYRYPFTNCTHCGPRFTIIEELTYDRSHTTMRKFGMCASCAAEYHNPLDRRFHAQPNACPECGPQLALWDAAGGVLASGDQALFAAAQRVRAGEVLALKGLGGFHLIVDAANADAVARLRERKHREHKPFALLYPSLETVRRDAEVSALEESWLISAEAPIVLLARQQSCAVAPNVAPRNPSLGVMLPCTPLHHLLMRELGFPVVATSGNLRDEPICIEEQEALERLRGLADSLLVHDRPIVRAVDDSVVREMGGRAMVLRRARGYAPLPVALPASAPTTLAVGAHLKNTVALSIGSQAFLSQHIGDLATLEAHAAFRRATEDLPRLYEASPTRVACDLHPDYLSTRFAGELPIPSVPVQHHWAHFAACLVDNGLEPPALGIVWDGTGYGEDCTVWGGEFLLALGGTFARVAHLHPFALPGGEAAIRQPRRLALSVLYSTLGEELWEHRDLLQGLPAAELSTLRQMLRKGLNSPVTTSAGRLFDAVSALLGLCERVTFEGEAAMELEFAASPDAEGAYRCEIHDGSPLVVDWRPMIREMLEARERGDSAGVISAGFHRGLVEAAVSVAQRIGQPRVALSGGCLQNKLLAERLIRRLRETGFQPCWHRQVPPNDGGIALGQIVAAAWRDREHRG